MGSPILNLAQNGTTAEVKLLATQCLEICTGVSANAENGGGHNIQQLYLCFQVFLKYLSSARDAVVTELIHSKVSKLIFHFTETILYTTL